MTSDYDVRPVCFEGNQERKRPRPKYPATNSTIRTMMMIQRRLGI
jgi:hypothetical protein